MQRPERLAAGLVEPFFISVVNMSKVDVWMPIYIGDYLRDTEELSGPEHGAYLLLLMHYWMKRGEIGSDIERLARVCRSDVETCRFILGSYFSLEDGNYKNKRADKEMQNAENRRLASSENGKKGGRPSKNNLEKTHRFSVGIPRHNLDHNLEKSSSPSPSYINNAGEQSKLTTPTPPKPADDDGFGDSAPPPAAAVNITQEVKNTLQASEFRGVFSASEIAAISERLAAQQLDAGYVAYAMTKAREPTVRSPGGFLKRALTGGKEFDSWPERYRAERSPPPQAKKPAAPSSCPACGGKVMRAGLSDAGRCKACGRMLELRGEAWVALEDDGFGEAEGF